MQTKKGTAVYAIHVQGQLGCDWADWFNGMTISRDVPQNITTLSGVVVDQAALHGLIARIRDLGLPLLALYRLEAE